MQRLAIVITLIIQCKTSHTMVAYEHLPESYLLQKPHIYIECTGTLIIST